jgi:hypothetical protein
MLKLIFLRKNEDSYWLKLQSGKKSLEILDSIFDLHDFFCDELGENKKSYDKILIDGERSFFKDYTLNKSSPKFTAYFIFTKKGIHVILRKVKGHKLVFNKILKHYDFIDSNKK